jgi:hypothetical protein
LNTSGAGSYGTLGNMMATNVVDSVLGQADVTAKSGYLFTVNPVAGTPAQYWAFALPATTSGVGATGTRRFAISEDGVLRGDTTVTAPADEAAVQAMAALGN